jgi:ankyrin repeat protein
MLEGGLLVTMLAPLTVVWWAANIGAPSANELLFAAAQNGDVGAMDSALSHASVETVDCCGFTPLMIAARAGQVEAVKRLLARGANMDANCNWGVTALMLAAQYDHQDVARILLAHGADPNRRAPKGGTALWYALQESDVSCSMIELLVAGGADPDARSAQGDTPLMTAASTGNAAIVRLLLEHGAGAGTGALRRSMIRGCTSNRD